MSARIERVAELAMELGEKHLEPYGSYKSRHDFTQRQLMSCLILKAYLKTTYRGVIDLLKGHAELRRILGLEKKLPHYTALQKFSARPKVGEVAEAMVGRIGQAALRREHRKGSKPGQPGPTIAIDSTGLQPTGASAYYIGRTGRKCRNFIKVSLSMVCGSLLPLGLVIDWGPSYDKTQAFPLLEKSFGAAGDHLPEHLLADAGYDADWMHVVCREAWGVKSWIKPVIHRADGKIGGYLRPKMTASALKRNGYGRRWQIESFFSGLKRFCGSTIASRLELTQRNEAIFRVLAYALHR